MLYEYVEERESGTSDTPNLAENEIASAGQTFSHGLEQSGGQSSGSNSDKTI